MTHCAITIRTYSNEGTVPDINAIINYLKPLGLTVDNIQIVPC